MEAVFSRFLFVGPSGLDPGFIFSQVDPVLRHQQKRLPLQFVIDQACLLSAFLGATPVVL
jgi:hypothetical protein